MARCAASNSVEGSYRDRGRGRSRQLELEWRGPRNKGTVEVAQGRGRSLARGGARPGLTGARAAGAGMCMGLADQIGCGNCVIDGLPFVKCK
jgi:hypothetical protein